MPLVTLPGPDPKPQVSPRCPPNPGSACAPARGEPAGDPEVAASPPGAAAATGRISMATASPGPRSTRSSPCASSSPSFDSSAEGRAGAGDESAGVRAPPPATVASPTRSCGEDRSAPRDTAPFPPSLPAAPAAHPQRLQLPARLAQLLLQLSDFGHGLVLRVPQALRQLRHRHRVSGGGGRRPRTRGSRSGAFAGATEGRARARGEETQATAGGKVGGRWAAGRPRPILPVRSGAAKAPSVEGRR